MDIVSLLRNILGTRLNYKESHDKDQMKRILVETAPRSKCSVAVLLILKILHDLSILSYHSSQGVG